MHIAENLKNLKNLTYNVLRLKPALLLATYPFSGNSIPNNAVVKDLVTEPIPNKVSASTGCPDEKSAVPNPVDQTSSPGYRKKENEEITWTKNICKGSNVHVDFL